MTIYRKTAGLALGIALACALGWAQADSDQPSLGDVARQQPRQKASKVFDDDNFQRSVPAPAPADDKAKAKADEKPAQATAPKNDIKALEDQVAENKKTQEMTGKQIAGIQARIDAGGLEGEALNGLVEAAGAYKKLQENLKEQGETLQKKLDAARAAGPKAENGSAKSADDAKPSGDNLKTGGKSGAGD